MTPASHRLINRLIIVVVLLLSPWALTPASAENYPALSGVKGLDTVFDVSLANPSMANIVFKAVRGVHDDPAVAALPAPPRTAIVFHGGAVKLLSTDLSEFKGKERTEAEKFAATLKQMKEDGIILEVCMYAVKVVGVDPSTLLPEIDRVGNGFISVAGYQAQGYGVVRIP